MRAAPGCYDDRRRCGASTGAPAGFSQLAGAGEILSDSFDLAGRVALVTGASRGIGRAVALLLARHGATVVVTSRKLDGCEKVAAEIRAAGGAADALACHVGEPERITAVMREIDARHGRLDILVNNAATNPYYGPSVDMDLAAWQKTVDVNLRGYFWASVEAARRMTARGKGAIVNVASVNAFRPMDGQAVYSMTKAALISMTATSILPRKPANSPGVRNGPSAIIVDIDRVSTAEVLPRARSLSG